MHNATLLSGYEEINQEENIFILIDFLNENILRYGTKEYTIVEYFPIDEPKDYIPNVYKLTNLTMEYENNIVFSDSADNKLPDMSLALTLFQIDSVIYIGFQNNDNKITISFDNGYIQIHY